MTDLTCKDVGIKNDKNLSMMDVTCRDVGLKEGILFTGHRTFFANKSWRSEGSAISLIYGDRDLMTMIKNESSGREGRCFR